DVVAVDELHGVLLEAPDAVVADDPDHVGAEAHERVEIAQREPERAVTPHHDDLAPGMGEGGGEGVPGAGAEPAVGTGIEDASRLVAAAVLPGVRPEVAAVADDDRVAVEPAPQLAVHARRPDRRRITLQVGHLGGAARLLLVAQAGDPRVTVTSRRRPPRRLRQPR